MFVKNNEISPTIGCTWVPGTRGSRDLNTNYTLFAEVVLVGLKRAVAKQNNSCEITLDSYPHHMILNIWVEAENDLGKVESEHLSGDADFIVKTSPPSDVKVFSEKHFPTSLLINWTHPIAAEYLKLIYQIRYCSSGSSTWTHVPPVDTAKYIQSFRLQYLQPDTVYVIQVSCKNMREGHGHWSDWSANVTARTPEDKPMSKPDLWRVITPGDSAHERKVLFICKNPVLSNGKIRSFDIRVQGTKWENVLVNGSDSESDYDSSQRKTTHLKQIVLSDRRMGYVEVIAHNSVGKSPKALLVIPKASQELSPVEGLKSWIHSGRLWLEWRPPNVPAGGDAHKYTVTEYVVEWASGAQRDWQREYANTTQTVIRGRLEKYKRYIISVYALFSGWTGKPVTVETFVEQGKPSKGPAVRLNGNPGSTEAELVWNEIPQDEQHGFITNYTIFYSTGTEEHAIPVSADTYSYRLKSLSSKTSYKAWIQASTIAGSCNGTQHSFITLKYAPKEIEGIVVGVCFGFLFLVLLVVLLCIYKRDSIKKTFLPQIPNPGNSSIGTWSPDFPSKADMPRESALADVSVVEVDLFDGKSVFEEDKACLPLKKDKYLSEEHSSGIGGSSCMSSPRQSVSDSDEGGDSSETTASTVQYSSVVACNGYKGQTPSCLPQTNSQPTFSRSESTQPLLDSEENPDMPRQESSRLLHLFPLNPQPRHSANFADMDQLEVEDHGGLLSLRFSALEEDSLQTVPTEEGQSSDWQQAAPVSNYMSQTAGYRPQ
uniref:Fibronectin type-III domain-containing protein n=1 Tax=Myripristis murdjan TaxID=586833 RepID=A0A668AL67_9TELE